MAAAKKKPHERVMEFVEKELGKDPSLRSAELFKRAKKVSRSISGLSVRQFHARYPLVVKRRLAAAKPKPKPKRRRKAPTRRPKPTRQPNRDAIREVLLGFARDLSAADSQTETIEVITGLDKYIDRIVAAA